MLLSTTFFEKKVSFLTIVWLIGAIVVACALTQLDIRALVRPPATRDLAERYFYKGLAKAEVGDLEQAIHNFTKVIELDPAAANAYYNRGLACAQIGDLQQAIWDYTRAIQLDPNSADAYANRGRAYAQLGNLEQAIRDFSQAIVLAPDFARTYYNRGYAYAFCGEFELAVIDLEHYLELAPDAFDRQEVGGFIEKLQMALTNLDTLVPGDTLASVRLQSYVLAFIDQFENEIAPVCQNRQVIHTEAVALLEKFQFEDGSFVQGSWQERWTLNRCGTTVFYQVTYMADGEGGVYFIITIERPYLQTERI